MRLNKTPTMLENVKVAGEWRQAGALRGILRKITPVRSCLFALSSRTLLATVQQYTACNTAVGLWHTASNCAEVHCL